MEKDDKEDIVIPHQSEIRCFVNRGGDITIMEIDFYKEERLIVVSKANAKTLAARLIELAEDQEG